MKHYEKETIWRLEGDYVESCNCDVVCPCLINGLSNSALPATYRHCDLLLGYRVTGGHYGDTDLTGCKWACGIYSPGPLMTVPNWSIAYYFDDEMSDEQYEALRKIVMGEAGGPNVHHRAVCSELLGVVRTKIDVEVSDKRMYCKVGEIGEVEVIAMKGIADPDEVVCLTNSHPEMGDCIQGLTGKMFYRDYGYNFHNAGKSGLLAHFTWQDNYESGLI